MRQAEDEHEALIDGWVLSLVQKGREEFEDILLALPGVYPKDLLTSISQLVSSGRIDKAILSKAETYVKRPSGVESPRKGPLLLPVPHPLDYAWRFSRSAVSTLMRRCQGLVGPEDIIVLLGAPTILLHAAEMGWQNRFILVDSDPELVTALTDSKCDAIVVCCDLTGKPLPSAQGAVVIVDPPWYPEYTRLFLWAATKLCQLGGDILLSFPAEGTRPGIREEYDDIIKWARQIGLCLLEIEQLILPYISPPFERNALATLGIHTVPKEWRRANLAVFRYEREVNVPRPVSLSHQERWHESILRGARIRVRQDSIANFRDPSLKAIVSGDILPSVSRRDSRRAKADVWTSGNRIFTCRGRAALINILQAMIVHESPYKVVEEVFQSKLNREEKELVDKAVCQIEQLVDLEQNDICRFYQG